MPARHASIRCFMAVLSRFLMLAVLCGLSVPAAGQDAPGRIPVKITVDADKRIGELREVWRFFGADEPNYAYGEHGETLVHELGQLRPQQVYFRAHNLLTTGDGEWDLKWGSTNAYTEDEDGNPVYDWTIVDRIFDTYIEHGVRPYVEIGFMPQALSTRKEPYRHYWRQGDPYDKIYTGWAYPPEDYKKWAELVFQWVTHCVERYGAEEVAQWYWQAWNEPNIGYWRGDLEEFLKLNDFTMDAVRRALPTARVGGADTAGDGGDFTRRFIEHSLSGENFAQRGVRGTPLDFISFHAKGSPEFVDGHVRMGMANQLRTIDRGFRIVASYPHARDKPIIIGESDPEGCAACQGDNLQYRNSTMYSSYTAASFARKNDLADRHDVNFEGALTWAFQFEEQPIFAGFRALATNGIDKPVMNVFRMYSHMSGTRIAAESSHALSVDDIMRNGVRGEPDIAAFASVDDGKLCAMVWYYHDDDLPGPLAQVDVAFSGIPAGVSSAKVTHYRVDKDHSNAYQAWLAMGSPQELTDDQRKELVEEGYLATADAPDAVQVKDGRASLSFELPRQGVSLFVLSWDQ